MDPYDHDVIRFLKEREIRLVFSELMPPAPPETPLDEWGAKLDTAVERIKERTDAIRQTPAPPPPRFGRVFDVEEVSGHTVCGVYLADREWAVLFVGILAEMKGLLDHVPRHLLLRYLSVATVEYAALLCSAAAWSANWKVHPDIQQDWKEVRARLDDLRLTRDSWDLSANTMLQHEVQAMTQKSMLRSGVVDEKWFYTIEAGPLDAQRWEAWFACGSLAQRAGVGAVSETLRVADTVPELQRWADGLNSDQLLELVRRHCAGAA